MLAYDNDSAKIESALNHYAQQGYRVISVSGTMIFLGYVGQKQTKEQG
jgi:hypothetical protein